MLAASSLLVLLGLAPSAPPAPVVWPEHREVLDVLPQDQLDVEEAKRLFAAGKQAAEHGRWDEAVRFFAEAYRHSGSPGQLYSLGRGHRELYFHQGRDPVQLRLALLRFAQYLEQSPQGRNRDNARGYIEELKPYVAVLEGFDQPVVITRLMIHSPVDGATVSVDGGPPRLAPMTMDVEPGPHRVQVGADGYHDAVRTVDIPEGATVPLEIGLQPRPAWVEIHGPAGATLYIDGQRHGRLPATDPVPLPAGPHQIAVAQSGRTPFIRELDLARGTDHQLDISLPMTTQRKLSFVAMGVGAGGLVAAGVLTGLALRSQARARSIDDERRTAGITEARHAQAQQAWRRRDALRTGAVTSSVAGAVALGTGLVLYFTDTPRLTDRLFRPDRGTPRVRAVVATPAVGLGWAGSAVAGRF